MNINLLEKLDRIHPYPAKYTVSLAIEYIEKYTKENDVVYDPFVGSGTTLLASKYLKRNSFGTDINFIAILISEYKVLDLTKNNISNLKSFISLFEKNYLEESEAVEQFNYPSIDHWFCEDSIKVLSLIKKMIDNVSDKKEKTFCELIFSSIINTASNQESDTRYAAIVKPKLNKKYVGEIFIKKFNSSIKLFEEIGEDLKTNTFNYPYLLDSKKCEEKIKANSVDLVLTSPPYPNTYDYYLYHKHRMNWLGFDVKFSMETEIGSRREFSSLKHPKEKFDNDMFEILSHVNNVLKVGGHAVLVMGDGKIQGETYEAKSNMERLCSKLNWKLIDYTYSMLDDTSRSFIQSYRTKGKKEHILVFKKEK